MTPQTYEELESLDQFAGKAMQAFSWSTFAFNLVLSYGLKYLWNLINLLQFSVFMTKWQLSYPNNCHAVLKYIKNLALMEFLPKDEVIDFLIGDEECDNCTIDTEQRRLLEATD